MFFKVKDTESRHDLRYEGRRNYEIEKRGGGEEYITPIMLSIPPLDFL